MDIPSIINLNEQSARQKAIVASFATLSSVKNIAPLPVRSFSASNTDSARTTSLFTDYPNLITNQQNSFIINSNNDILLQQLLNNPSLRSLQMLLGLNSNSNNTSLFQVMQNVRTMQSENLAKFKDLRNQSDAAVLKFQQEGDVQMFIKKTSDIQKSYETMVQSLMQSYTSSVTNQYLQNYQGLNTNDLITRNFSDALQQISNNVMFNLEMSYLTNQMQSSILYNPLSNLYVPSSDLSSLFSVTA